LNEAIECYTKAIEFDPLNPIYLCNRAICLIKQEKYSAAEKDCSLSISLDPNYVKAYHRRATARISLKKLEEAKGDYEHLLKLEPNNKLFQTELNKLQKSIDSEQFVFPVNKSEVERSKKPLRRIKIEEINDEASEKVQLEKQMQEINQKVNLSVKEKDMFNIGKEPVLSDSNQNAQPADEKVNQLNEDFSKTKLNTKPKVIEKENLENFDVKKHPVKIPDSPSNAYQFKKDWQTLSGSLDDLAIYFKVCFNFLYAKFSLLTI
jgi:tetratricopeptide (TPR) repeat protein